MVAAGKDRHGGDLAHVNEVQLCSESSRHLSRLSKCTLHRRREVHRDKDSFHAA